MPVAPQVPNDPEDVTGTFEEDENNLVYLADSEDLDGINSSVQDALDDANAALAAAQSAFTLASGSLQKSANTITNAQNQLTAINGNGVTVYAGASPTSGSRVVLNSAGIAGFSGSDPNATFVINANTGSVSIRGASFTNGTIFGGELNINGQCIISPLGRLTARDADITGTITGSTIQGGVIDGATAISTSGVLAGDTVSCRSIAIGTSTSGSLTANRLAIFNDPVFMVGPNQTTTSAAANVRMNTDTGQILRVSSSSQRFKTDIQPIEEAPPAVQPEKLLDVPVRSFKYRAEYLDASDQRANADIPGFIAEEMAEVYPIAADYDDDGLPVDWNVRYVVPGLLALIQRQQGQIKALEERLSALEAAT